MLEMIFSISKSSRQVSVAEDLQCTIFCFYLNLDLLIDQRVYVKTKIAQVDVVCFSRHDPPQPDNL